MDAKFTFVTTDGPALSASDAKAMRAHVTKTNFARRRRRIATEIRRKNTSCFDAGAETDIAVRRDGRLMGIHRQRGTRHLSGLSHPATVQLYDPLVLELPYSTDADRKLQYLLHEFAPQLFPGGYSGSRLPNESSWAGLCMTEPALLEACMALGVQVRPNYLQNGVPTRAEAHVASAISLVNERIKCTAVAITDSILATVFTLAFAELFLENDIAWSIHIDGLTKLIQMRQADGDSSVPSWFTDVLVYDGFSIAKPWKRQRYQQLISAIKTGQEEHRDIVDVNSISDDMISLRKALNLYYDSKTNTDLIADEIEDRVSRVQHSAELLAASEGPALRALGRTLSVHLQIAWARPYDVDTHMLVLELRRSLENVHLRICGVLDLTSWIFFVGALGSKAGSGDRRWFMLRLQRLLLSSPLCSWEKIMSVWRTPFMPDDRMLVEFRGLWDQLEKNEWY